jgi:oligogalacturonide lyase
MVPLRRTGSQLSRRRLLLLAASGAAARAELRTFPTEQRRFLDAATEFEVTRLTDPSHSSVLPAHYSRAVTRRNAMLFASDRTGSWQAYAMDLKSGVSRQLSDAKALNPATLTLSPDDRNAWFLDGRAVWQVNLGSQRAREAYRVPEGFEPGVGFSLLENGYYALLPEIGRGAWFLRQVNLVKGTVTTVLRAESRIEHPLARPRRASALYRGEDASMWLVHLDGEVNRRLAPAPGTTGPARWAPDGRTILYLNVPEDRTKLRNLRELNPDTGEDRMIAPTTQFVNFSVNGDASVFVGASGSRASPHVLLLLRVTRREMTLCEHLADDPSAVAPVFSPDSQRIYFASARGGKPAIFTMAIERLVEKTEGEPTEWK